MRAASPSAWKDSRTSASTSSAPVAVAAVEQEPRQRDRGVGAARLELERAAQRRLVAGGDERLGLARDQRVEEALDRRRGLGADELVDDLAVAERLDGRDALDPEGLGQRRVGVGVELGQDDLALALGRLALEHRARAARHGPHHSAQKSTTTGVVFERSMTSVWKVASLTSITMRRRVRNTAPPCWRSTDSGGDGPAVVLLHGLTATRRYVVMGSNALERGGHRVIAYDARGHGESDPAQPYDYAALAADLLGVLDEHGIERAVLAGASMGAHTALRFALEHPERVGGLVVITPAYLPRRRARPRALGRAGHAGCARAAWRASSPPTASRRCPSSGARRC